MMTLIVIGSTLKGVLTGAAAGFVVQRWGSLPLGIATGLGVGFVLSTVAAQGQPGHYWEIVLPGMLVGLLTGVITQRYPRDPITLRRDGDSARIAGAAHRAVARHASHPAWEWIGPVALGRGTHICVAQSVSPLARSLRQASRHPPGVPLARVRADLLAVAAQDVEDRLSGRPLLRRPCQVAVWVIASATLRWGPLGARRRGSVDTTAFSWSNSLRFCDGNLMFMGRR